MDEILLFGLVIGISIYFILVRPLQKRIRHLEESKP